MKAASCKNAKGIRWHPLFIRWCLFLRHQSSGAYETLRESDVVPLPSQRTLRDYTYYVKAHVGFSNDVDRQLMEAASVLTCEEWKRCVVILFDEMHIREDLVYEKETGAIVGFTNLGDVNQHLLDFERSIGAPLPRNLPEPLATTMTVFMVRAGLFTRLQFPYAQFLTNKVSGDLLFEPFWQAVEHLKRCGFKVLAATADGASVNRKLFKLHAYGDSQVVYKTVNPFSQESRLLFFFLTPHT